ncbi:MAG: hypothetical protein EOP06_13305, partial [Proteobacteria bacterium]
MNTISPLSDHLLMTLDSTEIMVNAQYHQASQHFAVVVSDALKKHFRVRGSFGDGPWGRPSYLQFSNSGENYVYLYTDP